MTNETDPLTVLRLANKAVEAMLTTEASPGEQIAGLRTAAFAIEQAMSAQQLAVVMSNIVDRSRKS